MRQACRNIFHPLLFTLVLLSSFSVQAITCKTESTNLEQIVDIEKIIKVSSSEMNANTKIWVSSPIHAVTVCTDTNGKPDGEDVFFYLDPQKKAGNLPSFLKMGITYNGVDYPMVNGNKVLIGPGTICNRVNGNCVSPATEQTLDLTYQVYIMATGQPIINDGKIANNLSFPLFQIDGVGGIKTGTLPTNYTLTITGLNKILTMACVPAVNISPTEVDFGYLSARNAQPGVIDKVRTFNVAYSLKSDGAGQVCNEENMLATFSTTNRLQGDTIILPSPDSGFGIILSENVSMEPRIAMNDPIKFTLKTEVPAIKTYSAGFLWTSNNPKLGPFSATATITLTFE
ncbi:TPA: fimbrial protein [Citrobacter freundii]